MIHIDKIGIETKGLAVYGGEYLLIFAIAEDKLGVNISRYSQPSMVLPLVLTAI